MDTTTLFGEEFQTELATRPNLELRNRPIRMEDYTKDRDDLMTPSKLTAGYVLSDFGTDLDAIDPFTEELTGIVDTMKEALANEARLLEGVPVPVYGESDWAQIAPPSLAEALSLPPTTILPNGIRTTTYQVSRRCATCGKDVLVFFGTADEVRLCRCENELSQSETKHDQWTTGSPNGFSRIDRTHTSTPGSSTSSSTVRPSSPVSGTPGSGGKSSLPLIAFCLATSAVSGCEIDATNESSDCTVPMISELTLGIPSEAK